MEEYIKTLEKILGKENFSQLSNELYLEVDKTYRKINIIDATEIVEYNLSNILVIGIEQARGCKKEDISKVVDWYNLGAKSYLLKNNIREFEKTYSKYIELIIKKVKEDEKSSK